MACIRTEQVHERGDVGAVLVRTARGLFELLRVAQQHQVARRPRGGQRLGQRHLPGLVDNQHVEPADGIGVGPQPRGAADDGARSDAVQRRACRLGELDAVQVFALVVLVHQAQVLGLARRIVGLAYGEQQVVDDLVADCRDADPLACRRERQDGFGTLRRLAGARWALHRQHAAVEFAAQAHEGLACVFVGTAQCVADTGGAARQTRAQAVRLRRRRGLACSKPLSRTCSAKASSASSSGLALTTGSRKTAVGSECIAFSPMLSTTVRPMRSISSTLALHVSGSWPGPAKIGHKTLWPTSMAVSCGRKRNRQRAFRSRPCLGSRSTNSSPPSISRSSRCSSLGRSRRRKNSHHAFLPSCR